MLQADEEAYDGESPHRVASQKAIQSPLNLPEKLSQKSLRAFVNANKQKVNRINVLNIESVSFR